MKENTKVVSDFVDTYDKVFVDAFRDIGDVFVSNAVPKSFLKYDDSDHDGVSDFKDCEPYLSKFQDLLPSQSDNPASVNPDEQKGLIQKIRERVKKYQENQDVKNKIISQAYHQEQIRQLKEIGRIRAKENARAKVQPIGKGVKLKENSLFAGASEAFWGVRKKSEKKKITIEGNNLMNLKIEDL